MLVRWYLFEHCLSDVSQGREFRSEYQLSNEGSLGCSLKASHANVPIDTGQKRVPYNSFRQCQSPTPREVLFPKFG